MAQVLHIIYGRGGAYTWRVSGNCWADISAPECKALMAFIATQSQCTLGKWAVDYAARGCLPIFEREYPEDTCMRGTVEGCRAYMEGSIKLRELKPLLTGARKLAAETRGEAAQAAARAVATACATVQRPTNAFGFLLYAAAAKAYAQLGTDRPQVEYDAFAAQRTGKPGKRGGKRRDVARKNRLALLKTIFVR